MAMVDGDALALRKLSYKETVCEVSKSPKVARDELVGPPIQELETFFPFTGDDGAFDEISGLRDAFRDGMAGAGGTLCDDTRNLILGFAQMIGIATAIVAELWGVLTGLEVGWRMGYVPSYS
ncbi:hypothetical protein CRG98_017517 [Punica granatum]|uniref:RNase H type-1 domain-containing protein n=1 Tax=Punica granatum TaxID=22663 RepID=A0A2I0K0P9_PUNGR|nr:hypothetical protein CRG98_017517 [Punica granatum]